LIIGHGIMGRLLARMVVAAGKPAPEVWETQPIRQAGAMGYDVIHPDEDTRKDFRCICDVSGDAAILNRVIAKMAPGGEVVLAGFYKQDLFLLTRIKNKLIGARPVFGTPELI
jgi:3-hydroxyethyl bacteriochlorophyllide a dehydrogenase